MSKQFLRFLLTGGTAALVNLFGRYLLNLVLPFAVAVPIAYLFGMVIAYILARLYVFQRSGRSRVDEFRRFAIVNVFSFLMVWVISVALDEWIFPAIALTWHAEDVAHFIGVLCPAVFSYFGHRSYTFAQTPASQQTDFRS